ERDTGRIPLLRHAPASAWNETSCTPGSRKHAGILYMLPWPRLNAKRHPCELCVKATAYFKSTCVLSAKVLRCSATFRYGAVLRSDPQPLVATFQHIKTQQAAICSQRKP